ncbi:MAG: hypothetical protein ACTJFS_15925, partial [Micrococcaceae bacterium]
RCLSRHHPSAARHPHPLTIVLAVRLLTVAPGGTAQTRTNAAGLLGSPCPRTALVPAVAAISDPFFGVRRMGVAPIC